MLAGLDRLRGPGVPRTLLDVGVHAGRFLHLARQAGWEAEGAEVNPVTAAYAARRTGAPVHAARAQDLAGRGPGFGAVTLTDVLEHIPRPAPLVGQLRGLLAPGGILAVKVPHGPVQRLKEGARRHLPGRGDRVGVMPRFAHVNHFTVAALRLCLHAAGFGPVLVVAGAPEFLPGPRRTRARRPRPWSAAPSTARPAGSPAASTRRWPRTSRPSR